MKLVGSVLGTTLRLVEFHLISPKLTNSCRWLDTTPTARVIARCTQDIAAGKGPFVGHDVMS
jgi:hypothetical protein